MPILSRGGRKVVGRDKSKLRPMSRADCIARLVWRILGSWAAGFVICEGGLYIYVLVTHETLLMDAAMLFGLIGLFIAVSGTVLAIVFRHPLPSKQSFHQFITGGRINELRCRKRGR